MVEVVWQDPPSRRSNASDYSALIEVLKENPGRWALVTKEWKVSSAPPAFRQSGCEATARRNAGKKTWTVYARYPGPKTPAAAQPAPPERPAPKEDKAAVDHAVAKGTALKPPAPAIPKRPAPAPVAPPNDFGIAKFRADREARGARP